MPGGGGRGGPGCRADGPEEGTGAAGGPTSQGRAAQGRGPPSAGDALSVPGRTKQGAWPGKPRPSLAGRERAGPETWAETGRRSARCSVAVPGPAACPQRKPLARTQPSPARPGPETRGDAGTPGRGSRRRGSSTCRNAVSQRRRGALSFPRAHRPRPVWAWLRTPRPGPAPEDRPARLSHPIRTRANTSFIPG